MIYYMILEIDHQKKSPKSYDRVQIDDMTYFNFNFNNCGCRLAKKKNNCGCLI